MSSLVNLVGQGRERTFLPQTLSSVGAIQRLAAVLVGHRLAKPLAFGATMSYMLMVARPDAGSICAAASAKLPLAHTPMTLMRFRSWGSCQEVNGGTGSLDEDIRGAMARALAAFPVVGRVMGQREAARPRPGRNWRSAPSRRTDDPPPGQDAVASDQCSSEHTGRPRG
jgi:hypothetical protein